MMKFYQVLLAAILACIVAAAPVAADQGKGKNKDKDEKRPVDIVREPKPDPNRGGDRGRGGNNDKGDKRGGKEKDPPPPHDLVDN